MSHQHLEWFLLMSRNSQRQVVLLLVNNHDQKLAVIPCLILSRGAPRRV
jgi:hypothetical protein